MTDHTANPDHPGGVSRRDFLSSSFNGFGALALGGALTADLKADVRVNPLEVRLPHLRRKAKHCIFMFFGGGVSQMDSFEYKPVLNKLHGKPLSRIPEISGELQGRLSFPHATVGSPFKFQRYGESGKHISDRFPHIARHVDDLAFIHGIKTDNQNHGPSTLHVTTGDQFPGSPSVGSWVSYGLGSPNQDMPSYVVIQDPRGAPTNGAAVWSNGYLPAAYQGTLLRPKGVPILNLQRPAGVSAAQQRKEFDALRWLNRKHLEGKYDTELEARISAYELAFRMQMEAPEIVDISREKESTRELYGLDQGHTAGFGRQCLLARRLVERGVRFVQIYSGGNHNDANWDAHGDLKRNHDMHALETDKPIAGLIKDLKQRGLFEKTRIVWGGEFGRQPTAEYAKGTGRDHNSYGFTMWMAGGGIKGGVAVGKTDELGSRAVENRLHVRNLHATVLNQLGLDPNRLSYFFNGLDQKLVGVEGAEPIRQII